MSKPEKYRKKAVVIEAVQLTHENNREIVEWSEGEVKETRHSTLMLIDTLEGQMQAHVGDYIVRGVNGEYHPCRPSIFEATYELVEEHSTA